MALTVSIEISPETEARLAANARSQGVSLAVYVQRMLEDAVSAEESPKRLKSSYGVLAKHGPAPSFEEIKAHRAEMFRNFAKGGEDR